MRMPAFGRTAVLTLALAAGPLLNAQAPDLSWGPELESSKRGFKIDVLGSQGSDVYVLRREIPGMAVMGGGTPKLYLEVYGTDLTVKRSRFIDLEDPDQDFDFETAFRSGDRLWVVLSQRDKGRDERVFYLQSVDPGTMDLGERRRIEASNATNNLDRMAGTNFAWASSPSGRYLGAMVINRDSKKPETFAIVVFDEALNRVWERRVKLRELDKDIEQKQFLVDDAGGAYVLMEREQGDETVHEAAWYANGEEEAKRFSFDTKDLSPATVYVQVKAPGVLTAVGMYASREGRGGSRTARIKGFFWNEADLAKGAYTKANSSDFPDAFLTAHLSERKAEKASEKDKAETRRFDISAIIPLADGGNLVLGEQFTSAIGTRAVLTKIYDIAILRLDAEGKLLWAERVAKDQEHFYEHGGGILGAVMADKFSPRTVGDFLRSDMDFDNIYSFGHALVGDAVWVFFNDDPSNLEDPDNRRTLRAATRKMNLVGVRVSLADGSQEKHLVFNAKEEDTRARPALGRQVDGQTFVLFSSKRKDLRPVRLDW